MRIPDSLLKCTGFISRDEVDLSYKASAFVVSVPHDERHGVMHLVTAKHVAAELEGGKAVIGMNGKDGRPIWIKNTTQVPWYIHPDETVDVAILPFATRWLKDYDYQDISTDRFLTADRRLEFGIGIGDETFNVGLFSPFIGERRFVPMVRTGVISMMSQGRVPHPRFGSMEAYLVEARSIGGLSGSPVFVRNTLMLEIPDHTGGNKRLASVLGDFHVLGLVSGHMNRTGTLAGDSQDANTGVSIVVPAEKILETLFAEELAASESRSGWARITCRALALKSLESREKLHES